MKDKKLTSIQRRIVTKASNDGTFKCGDHIIEFLDHSIACIEANGWIDAEDVSEATRGMISVPEDQ